jgi:tRNA G10  N-methylase Trm11
MERFALDRVLKVWKPSKTIGEKVKTLINAAGTEFITEFLQTFPEKYSEVYAENPDTGILVDMVDFYHSIDSDMIKEALYQGMIGGLTALAFAGPEAGRAVYQNKLQKLETEKDLERKRDALALVNKTREALEKGELSVREAAFLASRPEIIESGMADDINKLVVEYAARLEARPFAEEVEEALEQGVGALPLELGKEVEPEVQPLEEVFEEAETTAAKERAAAARVATEKRQKEEKAAARRERREQLKVQGEKKRAAEPIEEKIGLPEDRVEGARAIIKGLPEEPAQLETLSAEQQGLIDHEKTQTPEQIADAQATHPMGLERGLEDAKRALEILGPHDKEFKEKYEKAVVILEQRKNERDEELAKPPEEKPERPKLEDMKKPPKALETVPEIPEAVGSLETDLSIKGAGRLEGTEIDYKIIEEDGAWSYIKTDEGDRYEFGASSREDAIEKARDDAMEVLERIDEFERFKTEKMPQLLEKHRDLTGDTIDIAEQLSKLEPSLTASQRIELGKNIVLERERVEKAKAEEEEPEEEEGEIEVIGPAEEAPIELQPADFDRLAKENADLGDVYRKPEDIGHADFAAEIREQLRRRHPDLSQTDTLMIARRITRMKRDSFAKPGEEAPTEPEVTEEQPVSPPTPETSAHRRLAQDVKDWIFGWTLDRKQPKKPYFTLRQLFRKADEFFGGTQAEGKYEVKDAYDAMELGVNLHISDNPDLFSINREDPEAVLDTLEFMLQRLPTQTRRTGETDEFQQFSTPPTLAYLANWVAKTHKNDVMLEPSAGIGGLAVFSKNAGAKVVVNELSARRMRFLQEMPFDAFYSEDGAQINNILPKEVQPTLIVMNPPFSATAGRKTGTRDSAEGLKHLEQALKRLAPGGRLVAIMGRGVAMDRPNVGQWWNGIKQIYNVRANVGLSGKNYRKYGTQFDNQLIVIDKPILAVDQLEPGTKPFTGEIVTGFHEDLAKAMESLKEIRNDRRDPGEQKTLEQALQETPPESEPGPGTEGAIPAPTGSMGGATGGPTGSTGNSGTSRGPVSPTPRKPDPSPGDVRDERPDGPGGHPIGDTPATPPGGSGNLGTPETPIDDSVKGITPDDPPNSTLALTALEKERAKEALSESLFENYKPERMKIEGMKPHPTPLVQSAAMAAVTPPEPTYQVSLPQEPIDKGEISDIQLEHTVYAGQAHEEFLDPDAKGRVFRRGYFNGDGTGVGKGREIAAVMWDNWNKGRKKHLWISDTVDLEKDARRDMSVEEGIGWDPNLLFTMKGIKMGQKIPSKEGILFTSYATLASRPQRGREQEDLQTPSRLDSIVEWLGEDFDGVIAFDESHNMGNAVAVRGERGRKDPAQRALAGVELQERLPNARVLYVSATGATEVLNLAYATRLGLWGPGTQFSNLNDFVGNIARGGMTSMELVAQNMKSLGIYNARSLSYDGVEYDKDSLYHELTPEQINVYNTLANAWQIVLQNFDQAVGLTGITGRAKGAIYSRFWGANQRFFNQIVTTMQTLPVVKAIKKDIEAGNVAVVQLTNTLEASQDRAISAMTEEDTWDDLDLTPREDLMNLIATGYPVIQWEEYTDDQGNVRTRPVRDSEGNYVENPEAVAARERLLDQIGAIKDFPESPIDLIVNGVGVERVAEVTGRSRRIVQTTEGRKKEDRSDAKANQDARDFMAGKKDVLIFSEKGGTGRSYHADLKVPNQKKRVHYLLQPGWRADKAMQGLGRTHRSNQKQPPKYILVSTNLSGSKRFVSSIARRLDQLGALTRGHREAGSQGLFTARDNLESEEAKDALRQFFRGLYNHDFDQIMDIDTYETMTGLRLRTSDKDGQVTLRSDLPPIRQFLNRLLNMTVEAQNRTFQVYGQYLDGIINHKMELGTLDVGMETVKGDPVEKVSQETIFTDEKSGAQTHYTQIDVTNPAPILKYNEARTWAGAFYRNIRSQKVWAGREVTRTNLETGAVEQNMIMRGHTFTQQTLDMDSFNDPEKWEKLGAKESETLWNAAVDETPATITNRKHIVSGAVLPVWKRIPGHKRVVRVQTSDGDRFIGIEIHDSVLAETLRNLGAEAQAIDLTPKQISTNVVEHNWTIEYANGVVLKRRRTSGEDRILLKDISYSDFQNLEQHGVFSERIAYETMFFVPVGDAGIPALQAIGRNNPITRAVPPVGQEQGLREGETLAQRAERETEFQEGPVQLNTEAVPLEEVQSIFKGQKVEALPDGFAIETATGRKFSVHVVERVPITDGERLQFEIKYGRPPREDKVIAGKAQKHAIWIDRNNRGETTVAHETFHMLELAGVINRMDISILKAHIKRLVQQGAFDPQNKADIGGAEDRANFVAAELIKPPPKGALGKVVQKIRDFVDSLVNLFERTAGGVVRDIKTGRVFEEAPGPPQIEPGMETRFQESTENPPSPAKPTLDIEPATADERKRANEWLDRQLGNTRQEPVEPAEVEGPDPPSVGHSRIKAERDAYVSTLKSWLPKNMPALSLPEQALKSPEWWNHPIASRIVRAAIERHDVFSQHFNNINEVDDPMQEAETVSDATTTLKRKGLSRRQWLTGKTSPEYKQLLAMIEHGDTEWTRDHRKPLEEQIEDFEKHWREKGASEEVIRTWRIHRAAYDKSLDRLMAPLYELLAKLEESVAWERSTQGLKYDPQKHADIKDFIKTGKDTLSLRQVITLMNQWRGFYAPRIREPGEWVVRGYRGRGPNKTFFRYHKTTRIAAERLASKLVQQGKTLVDAEGEAIRGTQGAVHELRKLPDEVYEYIKVMSTQQLIDRSLKGVDSKDADTQREFRESLYEEVADMIRARGYRSAMIRRGKGQQEGVIEGYIQDPLERFVRYTANVSAGLAKADAAYKMMVALNGEFIDGKKVGGIDAAKEARVYNAMTRYIQEQLRNLDKTDRMIGMAKAVASFKYLGFPNVRAPFVNMTAMMTTVPASMHQYGLDGKVGFEKIAQELVKGGKDFGKFMLNKKAGFTTNELAFLKDLQEKGYDNPQYTREAMGTIQSLHGKGFTKAMAGSMWMFSKTEQWNRGSTMLATYRLARKQGFSHAEASTRARTVSDKAHGIYGRATLPAWAQGKHFFAKTAQMFYIYQKFGHNWLQMAWDLGVHRSNYKAMVFTLAAPVVLGGAASIPLASVAYALINAILSAGGDDRDAEKFVHDMVREHMGDTGERIFRHGALGAAHIDISGSFAVDPAVPKKLIEFTGAVGGVATDIVQAGHFMTTGQFGRAAETALPIGVGNWLRAFRERGGATTRRGTPVWDEESKQYVPGTGETVLRTLGFRTSRRATVQARLWEGKREQKRFDDRRNTIYEKVRVAHQSGGQEQWDSVMDDIVAFNDNIIASGAEAHVSMITIQSLKRLIRGMHAPSKRVRGILER